MSNTDQTDITPVKNVKIICCRTCRKHLENTKDRYKLFGAQDLAKTLESIVDATVQPADGVDYICSSCRAKMLRFNKVNKEFTEIKQSFKESNNSEVVPAIVRLKRGRKTPPNAAKAATQGPQEPRQIAPKALRSINFIGQTEAPSFSSQDLATISNTATATESPDLASVEVSHLPSMNNNNKSTQTTTSSDKKSAKSDYIEDKIVVSHYVCSIDLGYVYT